MTWEVQVYLNWVNMGILPASSIYEMDCILVNTLLALQADFQDMLDGLQQKGSSETPDTMVGMEAAWERAA